MHIIEIQWHIHLRTIFYIFCDIGDIDLKYRPYNSETPFKLIQEICETRIKFRFYVENISKHTAFSSVIQNIQSKLLFLECVANFIGTLKNVCF